MLELLSDGRKDTPLASLTPHCARMEITIASRADRSLGSANPDGPLGKVSGSSGDIPSAAKPSPTRTCNSSATFRERGEERPQAPNSRARSLSVALRSLFEVSTRAFSSTTRTPFF